MESIMDRVGRFFREEAKCNATLVYAFGSRVMNREGPMSDYDIAVLFERAPSPDDRYDLAHRVSQVVGGAPVDLVVLNKAPPELAYGIVATGRVIYERTPGIRVEFETRTLSRYFDYLPVLREQKRLLLEETDDEPGIQRYRKALAETERVLAEIRAAQE
jgi:predicted nucleotidyltransferase